jgi:hypothetical protein
MWDQKDTIGAVILVGGMFLVWWIERALKRMRRPRFITDEHGERQRVIAWNRGQPVYDPKTWQQRVHEEAVVGRKRRSNLLGAFFLLAVVVGFGLWVGQYSHALMVLLLWGGGVGIIGLLAIGMPALVKEIAYQLGYQGMQGAKVLDAKPPPPPGRELVEQQKAHGDARVAGEAEALSLLRSKK